ncbi:MAG: DUF2911 domain-containing protein [Bacteroidetes bacterium]|nr:DUF2911 domain-containing protein [Bacteroidota bacterium]
MSPAETATATIGENIVTVNYGSPRVKDRTIWGELVPYNEVWRAGANEATTISFTQDVMINGQLLKKILTLFLQSQLQQIGQLFLIWMKSNGVHLNIMKQTMLFALLLHR